MKVNIIVDSNNIITDVITYPLKDIYPIIEINSLKDITVRYDKFKDGKIIKSKTLSANMQRSNLQEQIEIKKQYLKQTDYKLFKYLEGCLSESDYEKYKEERQKARDIINELEEQLAKIKD